MPPSSDRWWTDEHLRAAMDAITECTAEHQAKYCTSQLPSLEAEAIAVLDALGRVPVTVEAGPVLPDDWTRRLGFVEALLASFNDGTLIPDDVYYLVQNVARHGFSGYELRIGDTDAPKQ